MNDWMSYLPNRPVSYSQLQLIDSDNRDRGSGGACRGTRAPPQYQVTNGAPPPPPISKLLRGPWTTYSLLQGKPQLGAESS